MKYLPLIVVFALILPIHVASQPNQTPTKKQQSAQPESPSPTIGENNYTADDHSERPETNPPKWYAAIERPDWWLVFIAALTGLAIAYQAREMTRATVEMRKSAESFISKERARLSIEVETLVYEDADLIHGVHYKVRLYGPTIALVKQSCATAEMTGSKETPNIVCDFSIPVILPKIITAPETRVFALLTDNDMEAVQIEKKFIHFWGCIQYEDIFGGQHTTMWSYRWDDSLRAYFPGVTGNWIEGPAEYNQQS